MEAALQRNESISWGTKPWFKTLWKKIKEGAHKIWEDLKTSPKEWSYYDAYKDHPDKLAISHMAFYSSKDLDSIRETIRYYYDSLKWDEKPEWEPFFYAMFARGRLQVSGGRWKPPYIGVVDFSKPNTQHRFFVINLNTLQVENAVCTWHWKNSWEGEVPTEFSNDKGSLKSSVWAFVTEGKLKSNKKGTWKWIQLTWWDNPNYRARSRWIFIHPWGVDQSEWCFTIPYEHDKEEVYNIIKKLEWWCLVYAYYSEDYLRDSWLLNPSYKNERGMSKATAHFLAEDMKSIASKTKSSIKKLFNMKKAS